MEPDVTSKDTKASKLQVTETKYEGSKHWRSRDSGGEDPTVKLHR